MRKYTGTSDLKKGVVSTLFAALLLGTTFYYYHVILRSLFIERIFSLVYEHLVLGRFFSEVFFPNLVGRFAALLALVLAGVIYFTKNWRHLFRAEYIFLGVSSFGLIASMKYGSGNNQCIMLYPCFRRVSRNFGQIGTVFVINA